MRTKQQVDKDLTQLHNDVKDTLEIVDGLAESSDRIEQKVDGLTERLGTVEGATALLDQKIDGVAADLGGRIDGVAADLGGRIDGVEGQIGELSGQIGELAEVQKKQWNRIDTWDRRFSDISTEQTRILDTVGVQRLEVGDIEAKVEAHDRRFDAVDERFDAVEAKLASHDERFDVVDSKLDTVIDMLGKPKQN